MPDADVDTVEENPVSTPFHGDNVIGSNVTVAMNGESVGNPVSVHPPVNAPLCAHEDDTVALSLR